MGREIEGQRVRERDRGRTKQEREKGEREGETYRPNQERVRLND